MTPRGTFRRWGVRSIKALVGTVLLAGTILVTQPLWLFTVVERVFPRIVWRVEVPEPLVALTFDDGPDPEHTPRILALLARHQAKATFFMIGDRALGNPDLVKLVRDGGHEIGNHYYRNGSALRMTPARYIEDLLRTERVLALSGARKLFRPPSGVVSAAQLDILEARGYRSIMGTVYPFDTSRPPSVYVGWLVTKNLTPGSIVILHDGARDASNMIVALEQILAMGAASGLRFVTVSSLLDKASAP